tara:strand:- start:7959 stop:8390 length:432 start_codon:yes stop_codon:yes gene_type:complete
MSKIVSQTATQNMLTTVFDTTKLVLKGGEYNNAVYTNSTGGPITILVGTLLGRVSASDKVLPLKSAAVDGSQFPVGISCQEIIVADAASVTLEFVIAGEVEGTLLVLDGADTLATAIDGKTLGDRIKSDTLGILLINSDELSA